MKRVLFFLIILVSLAGCQTTNSVLKDQLQGTWVKENGSIWTFTKNKFEYVDMEVGIAGYGTFKFNKNQIIFDRKNEFNMDRSTTTNDPLIKKFQKEAWKEYHNLHPGLLELRRQDNLLRHGRIDGVFFSDGKYFLEYELNNNILIIYGYSEKYISINYPEWDPPWIDLTLYRQ
jgi:hypothetical protein